MITGLNQCGQLFRTSFRYIWPQSILYPLLKIPHVVAVDKRDASSQDLIAHHPEAVDVSFEGIVQ
jgi:hypothetical protein